MGFRKFKKLFGYPGGQKRLLKHLLKLLPDHKEYIEVFGGGATLLLNKERSKFEVFNDINSNITTLFQVVKDDFDAFSKRVEYFLQSREVFESFKRELKDVPAKVREEVDPVTEAAMTYYLLRTSFDGRMDHFSVKKHTDKGGGRPFKLIEEIKEIHNRLKNVVIECMDFEKLIEKYDDPDAYFFCDPPYYEIVGLYQEDFTKDDHIRFFKVLKDVEAKFLVTYGDHEFIRLLWRKFYHRPIITTGSMGIAEERKKVPHLLIANYDICTGRFKPFQARYFQF